ncbi:MAG: AAA family ATPase [Myxococcales bacterium]|nr:AAA family ATPase [Myxococcales bacterium]
MIFEFGDFELDLSAWRLRHRGQDVHVQRKAFDVLCYLVEHRERPVSRDELLDRLWEGDAVSPAVLTVAVSKARQAIGQASGEDGPIATEHGRGYRFVAEVRTRATPLPQSSTAPPVFTDDAAAGPASVFVGRERVMAALLRALSTAEAGQPLLRLIEGEPGVGKTRAAEELASRAAGHGIEVLWGRSREAEGVPAFWPWLPILRSCLASLGERRAREHLGAGFAELSRLLPELGAEPLTAGQQAPAEATHYRIFDAVTRLLLLACQDRPRLMIFDDLHWGDPASVDLLGYLLPELGRSKLMIVATFRDTELVTREHGRTQLDHLARYPNCERLTLRRLKYEDVERYTAAQLGRSMPELSRAVFERSEGNAFFMTEALHSLSVDGRGEPTLGELPKGSFDIVRRRLRALGSEAEAVLRAAAMFGRSFSLGLLAEVMSQPALQLRQRLQPALDRRLIVAVDAPAGAPHERFDFAHGLIRTTLVDDLELAERARLQLEIAKALDVRRQSGIDIPVAEIAHHYISALPHDHVERALSLALEAAQGLEALYAYDAAAKQYESAVRALRFLSVPDPGRRIDMLLALGHARRMSGQLWAARTTYERALSLARREQRPRQLALSAIGLRACQPMRAVPEPELDAALAEALMVLPDGERALRARVLARLSGQRTIGTRSLMSQRAAELAVDIEDPVTRHDVLLARLHATQTPDALDERLELADQLVAFADAQGQPFYRWEGLLARFDVALRRGEMGRVDALLQELRELADALHHPGLRHEARRLRAQRRLCAGELGVVGPVIEGLLREAQHLGLPFGEFNFMIQSGTLFRDLGIPRDLVAGSELFLERFPWARDNSGAQIAVQLIEAGQHERAEAIYRSYRDQDFKNVLFGEDYVFVTAHLLLLAAQLGCHEDAEVLYGRLEPYADHVVVNSALIVHGSCQGFLGAAARRLGWVEKAREHLERAVESNRRMGARASLVRSLLERAELALQEPGGQARVDTLLDEAFALADAASMAALAARARELQG